MYIHKSDPLPGTTRIPGGTFERNDEIQMWGELHKVHSSAPGERRGEVRLTLQTQRGTAGWTIIVQAGPGYLGKKAPKPFEPGTVIAIGAQSYLRQAKGWAFKNGLAALSDDVLRRSIERGEVKVIFEPSSVVDVDDDDDFLLDF